jgi:hypothetical protein
MLANDLFGPSKRRDAACVGKVRDAAMHVSASMRKITVFSLFLAFF